MRGSAILLVILTGGCGTKLVDPCAHQAAACLAIQIDSSTAISHLSAAQIHVSGGSIDVDQLVRLQGGASSTELPVAVAILFPSLTEATSMAVDVIGELNGAAVGQGDLAATISPGQHTTLHLALKPITGDAGDGGDVDMASSDLAGYVPLTVTLAGDGTGAVTGSGITCDATTCSGQYPPHTTVTLAASPATNADFAGWSGAGCTGTSTCVLTLDAATAVTAMFTWKFVPSHVSASAYRTGAANLSGVTAIDTHDLTINGAPPPNGITFVFENGNAVLSVAQWTINSGVHVTGDAPLIVVAAGPVLMADNVFFNGSAQGAIPGPGGNGICSASGAGESMPATDGAGGGGNYGGGASASTGAAGSAYGATMSSLCGGASGGTGTTHLVTDTTCKGFGLGGGGGGAIQISSAVSVTLHGSIVVSGGGGGGGCSHSNPPPGLGYSNADAGGGGSGGEVFIEAPSITIDGGTNHLNGLYANGGGGGGPKPATSFSASGADGVNDVVAASGGTGSTSSDFGGNGAFSPNGTDLTPATAPSASPPGGGGGGVGRIWLRTRGSAPVTTGAQLTPKPMIDQTL